MTQAQRGFTLLEMAVVITIIAVVTGMAVVSGIGILASGRDAATQQKLAQIDKALFNFRIIYDRLPCPASLTIAQTAANFGVEAATPGACTGGTPAANFSMNNSAGTAVSAVEGTVPVATLGLPADAMFDGWGNRIRYAVDAGVTRAGMFTRTPLGAACGPLTVNDVNGNARTTTAIYALVSQGANGLGAYARSGSQSVSGPTSSDEQTNCHCTSANAATSYNGIYVQRNPRTDSTSASTYYDDVVSFAERWQMAAPTDTIGSACPAIYVADTGNKRIQKFDLAGNYVSQFGASGSGNGQFQAISGVSVDSSGGIWVSDSTNNRVQVFTAAGSYVSQFGTNGSGNGQFSAPQQLAWDASGLLWAADKSNARVERFTSGSVWTQTIGGGAACVSCTSATSCTCTAGGGNNSLFGQPRAVAPDPNGGAWVLDLSANVVQKFDAGGNFLFQFGASGSGNSQFSSPQSAATDNFGNLFIADSGNNRIQKFDASGNYLLQFGTSGSTNGKFTTPSGIASDALGNIYVSDSGNNRVQVFDQVGNYLFQFGSSGSTNGKFSAPGALAITR